MKDWEYDPAHDLPSRAGARNEGRVSSTIQMSVTRHGGQLNQNASEHDNKTFGGGGARKPVPASDAPEFTTGKNA